MTNISTSIIIVTYNVAGFIAFCIDSILRQEDIGQLEIIVIDNCSSDGSVSFIEDHYPNVHIISNDKNLGFSKACNQGAQIAKGDTLFFLNPDCIVEEDTIGRLTKKARQSGIGIVGPLLIDGAGHILPESARELPTTMNGLNKILGLPFHEAYPYYRRIAKEKEIEAPVLCGACMVVEKRIFNELGGFDERFFMYGEDVDLSVSSVDKNYKNICLSDVRVLHFKGESTDKNQLQNNYNFYNAIKLYVQKHNVDSATTSVGKVGTNVFASSFSKASYVGHRLKDMVGMICDFIIIVFCFWALQFVWSFIKIGEWHFYGIAQYLWHYVAYSIIWVVVLYLNGRYFYKSEKNGKAYKSALLGGVVLLVVYALMPESLRFSRMILVLSILIVPVILSVRYQWSRPKKKKSYLYTDSTSSHEGAIVEGAYSDIVKTTDDLRDLNSGDDLIFDFEHVTISKLIDVMLEYSVMKPIFKFWKSRENLMFSSHDKSRRGQSSLSISHYHLSQPSFLLQKRVMDVIIVLILYVPLMILSGLKTKMMNSVLQGKSTLVGYDAFETNHVHLPIMKPSLLRCFRETSDINEKVRASIDYAANYTIFDDIFIVILKFQYLTKVIQKGKVDIHEGRD